MPDITSQTLSEIIKNIREKKLSSQEVTKAFVDRSEKSKLLNSFITEDFSTALEKSKIFDDKPNFDLKLPGVPMAIKDLFCTNGIKTTAGSKILNNFVPTYESTVTSNLWNEGAFLLGKLNCDEFAMGSSNETSFFGNVINPVGNNFIPGGSSGGSAAALAANLTPTTIGTDTGGSIRQPASFTGTVGLKPTYGRCSRWGIVAFASSLLIFACSLSTSTRAFINSFSMSAFCFAILFLSGTKSIALFSIGIRAVNPCIMLIFLSSFLEGYIQT